MTKLLDGLASAVITLLIGAFLTIVVGMIGWLFWLAIVEREWFAIAGASLLLVLVVVGWAFDRLTKKEIRENEQEGHWID